MVPARSVGRSTIGGYALVVAVGSGLLALHLWQALQGSETAWTFVFGIAVPVGFTVALLAGAAWLVRSDVAGRDALRVGGWCLVGCLVLGSGAVLIVVYQRAHGAAIHDPAFVVVDAVSMGGALGFVLGVYDCRQRRARAAHAEVRERSEQLNRQLGVLNRVLRHDIRNSANVIRGRADLLEGDDGDGAHLDAIERRAMELVELGDQAQDIEQVLRTGETERAAVDLTAVVGDQIDGVVRDHGPVDLEVSLPDEAVVSAHPLVGTAVGNVVENAVVHNGADRPSVAIDLSQTDDAERFELAVVDDGPGIPAEQVAVLERGYETPLEHTSGLGLWLVNWITTESGGDVAFESHDDGSVVRLTFERAP